MAIRSFSELIPLTFSWLEDPYDQKKIARNTLRLVVWESLYEGIVAIISAVFNQSVALKASLGFCGTAIAISSYIIYKSLNKNNARDVELNTDITHFFKSLGLIGSVGALTAFLTDRFFNPYPPIKLIAGHLMIPLAAMGLTALTCLVHNGIQQKQYSDHLSEKTI